jgi:Cu(I)/Ag(I) efflux system membrane fusion protein
MSCNNRGGNAPIHDSVTDIKLLYTCSMHPQIIRDQPGQCPICGMTLTRKVNDLQSAPNSTEPVNESAISAVPVTTIKQRSEAITIEAIGNIQNDTRELATISAKVAGRIKKLYVRYRYQMIMPGDKIMEIYSPELSTAQQNLLFILKNDSSNSSLIESAEQKLLLAGMSTQQLQQLINTRQPSLTISIYSNAMGHVHEAGEETMNATGQMQESNYTLTQPLSIREGMYLQAGQKVFSLTNPHKAWAVLNIFPENQHVVKIGNTVTITPETMPGKAFKGSIDFIEPAYRQGNKTLTARVYFDNYEPGIPIGSQVRATILRSGAEGNWLPVEAVRSLGLHDVAFVKTSSGFEARKVQTGIREKNQVQIINGLTITDTVALNAAYFTDSDSFIKLKQ